MEYSVPKVSVCMITYNHEKYIEQAIEGVLMQKTNFFIELIIGEDCSTDNTRSICKKYEEKYPHIIHLKLPKQNLGMTKNFIECLSACKGKYVAICEGDDYWIDPLKLQKQVDFMKENHDYSMCFHNAIILYQTEQYNVSFFNNFKADKDLTVEESVCSWLVPTASMLLRADIVKKYLNWLCQIYSGDYSMILTAFHHGKIRYINSLMSVYRIDYSGTSASALMKNKCIFMLNQKIVLLKDFNEKTDFNYRDTVDRQINYFEKELKIQLIKKGQGLFALFSFDTLSLLAKKAFKRLFV